MTKKGITYVHVHVQTCTKIEKIAKKAAKTSPKRHQKLLILLQNYPNFVAKFTDFFHENFDNFSEKTCLCDVVTICTQHGTNFYGRNQMVPGL